MDTGSRHEASAGRMGELWDPDTEFEFVYVWHEHFVTGKSNISRCKFDLYISVSYAVAFLIVCNFSECG